jgi:hypothetical protein
MCAPSRTLVEEEGTQERKLLRKELATSKRTAIFFLPVTLILILCNGTRTVSARRTVKQEYLSALTPHGALLHSPCVVYT